jgi:DNA-binding MarR family transcriptional regulator
LLDQLSGEEKAVYRALVRVVFAAPRSVTADIMCESGLGLSDCIVLEALAEAPGHRMRMAELADACGVSRSRLNRIMNRLEREGLTQRTTSPADGRGRIAVLTEAGHASLDQMRPAHLASVRRHIFDHLGDLDLACFTSSMDRVADSLVANGSVTRRSQPASAAEPE